MSAPLFGRVIVADWSANASPKRGADSIWLAVCDADGVIDTVNPSTRREAEAMLVGLCASDDGPATLLGVDFSLGYPRGTADLWCLHERPAWTAIWQTLAAMIEDGPRNANNRFAVASTLNGRGQSSAAGSGGPFWGCPPSRATSWLSTTKPARLDVWPAQWRSTETAMRRQGHRPFDCWQLLGAGSVGSQSLTGIPMLERLRTRFDPRVQVWPFSHGLRRPVVGPGSWVVAEVWPSLQPFDVAEHSVRDQAQVIATARWLADADRRGELGSMFEPSIGLACTDAVTEAVAAEEGWVLGVHAPSADGPGR